MMYQHRLLVTLALAWFTALSFSAHAQLADKKALTLEAAKKMAAAAEVEAVKNKWNVVIAVVDDGGHLIYLQRMDGTQTGSINVAVQKALAALRFKRSTKLFQDMVTGDKPHMAGHTWTAGGASRVRGGEGGLFDAAE